MTSVDVALEVGNLINGAFGKLFVVLKQRHRIFDIGGGEL